MESVYVTYLIAGVIFGTFTQALATSKGYDKKYFFWIGFLFNIIGLLFVMGLKNLESDPSYNSSNAATKKCPFCAELIKAEAKVCRYCNREIS